MRLSSGRYAMLAFLRRSFVLGLGFTLIASFIWVAGPYFAFADHRPLEPVSARLVAIAVAIACWFAWRLLKRFRAARTSDRLVAAVLAPTPASADEPTAEVLKLRERFEGAVATLKQQRRGGHSLYELPWFVLIGAPGAGKTTALLNSGLKFPLEQKVGKAPLRGVGGTRNCDWWFTDDAVFLDTAGRYTTQDSDAASDRAAWQEFLALLRKYRHRRPLNGVILTISAQDLMVQGESGREAHVEAAQNRLRELGRELRIRLPVYVMVTKCDQVAGFSEYFDDLAQEGRAQVWGVTFSYEETTSGEAPRVLPGEFEALIKRLNERLPARIEEERDVRRRARIFAFPQQMAALGDSIMSFVADVFTSTRFDQPVLLRGVYLTSGTQDGTQIDRLLGAIGRRFGLASEVLAPTPGRGKAYFVHRFLKDVVIGESGLAGVNRRVELRKAAVQLGAYAAMLLVAVVGFAAVSISYGQNRGYLSDVSSEIARLRDVPLPPSGAPLEAALPRLDAIRRVVDTADRHRGNVPWRMRWGMYQGRSVGNSARDAYVRQLDSTLLPRLGERLRQRLVQYAAEPERLYVYLKAYLMLGEPKHLDKEHLQFLADVEWRAGRGATDEGAALSKHFQSLLEYGSTLRPIAIDPALVAQARTTIRRASIPRIMYMRLQREYERDSARAVRLDVAGGVGVEQVLRRRSGTPLEQPVPGLYSRPVFQEATRQGMAALVKQFADDAWVWGDGGLSAVNPVQLAAEITDVYERDYIAAWDAVLNDLELVSFSTARQTANALEVLAGPTSPLRGVLRTVVEHTALVEAPGAAPAPGTTPVPGQGIRDRLGKLLETAQAVTGALPSTPGTLVTAHFQPVHELMAGAPGAAPVDQVLARIGEIHQQLAALGPEVGGASPLDAFRNPELRGLLQALRKESVTLPPFLRNLVAQIGESTESTVISDATGDLEARYERDVLSECRRIIADRYPFTAGSGADVPLADFSRLLGYGGVFDAFFRENLAPLVDVSRSPWTWRPGAVRSSPRMLSTFEGAQRVREALFPAGSAAPSLQFTVMLSDLDASATRFILEIDGQRFDHRHGPPRVSPVAWPARTPGEAIATFEDRFGAWPTARSVGPWALFRLVDAGRPQVESDVRLVLTFENGGRRARVTLDASTLQNPFTNRGWQQFRCGS